MESLLSGTLEEYFRVGGGCCGVGGCMPSVVERSEAVGIPRFRKPKCLPVQFRLGRIFFFVKLKSVMEQFYIKL